MDANLFRELEASGRESCQRLRFFLGLILPSRAAMIAGLSATIIGMVAIGNAEATAYAPFTDWEDITRKSPDIIVVKCTFSHEHEMIVNGAIHADVEVLSVLKGETKPGIARVVSQYALRQGGRYLVFSTYQTIGSFSCYNACEDYLVIPINSFFLLEDLKGKSLPKQIHLLLRSRLADVDRELEAATVEKKRLKDWLNMNTRASFPGQKR